MSDDDIARIRPATIDDASAFPSIERSGGTLFRAVEDLAWLAEADDLTADRYREIVAERLSWVAVDQLGRCVGFLCATAQGDELHVCEMAVLRDCQRRGHGRALLAAALSLAAGRDFVAVTLTTFRDIPWNAPFYRRLGFEVVARDVMSDRLRVLLDEEEALRGLPVNARCAMRLPLTTGTRNSDGRHHDR